MTKELSLWEQFQSLRPSTDANPAVAIPCDGDKQHLLVRGEQGEPALLLATEIRTSPRANIRLKHVGVQFDLRFEVAHGDNGTEVGNFCKFICAPSAPHLHQCFVELMAATARTYSGILNTQESDQVVDTLLEIFRKLSLPADQSVKGLWGELLLIYLSVSPEKFIDAWHLRTTDSFDFAFPDKRIEVKTTEHPSREHTFTLKQLRSDRDSDLVASIILSRSSAGLSVLDLVSVIADRVDASQQTKLWRLVFETLGEDSEADFENRFDVQSAAESLVFFRASDVPAPEVSQEMAAFVTEVRFRSNLNFLCLTSALEKKEIL